MNLDSIECQVKYVESHTAALLNAVLCAAFWSFDFYTCIILCYNCGYMHFYDKNWQDCHFIGSDSC